MLQNYFSLWKRALFLIRNDMNRSLSELLWQQKWSSSLWLRRIGWINIHNLLLRRLGLPTERNGKRYETRQLEMPHWFFSMEKISADRVTLGNTSKRKHLHSKILEELVLSNTTMRIKNLKLVLKSCYCFNCNS